MKILVTGGAGLVGSRLAPLLRERGHDVVAVDVRAPRDPSLRFVAWDLAEDPTRLVVRERPDVVVHLAARIDPPSPRERIAMRRVHVDATAAFARAARAGVVRKVALASSATVYGAWPDNPVPLDEDHPVRPLPSFPYAVDKADAERALAGEAMPGQWIALRPAIIYGRGARSYLTELVRRAPGVFPALDGLRPPLQFVHVDDVAEAFARAIERDLAGAFNVAAPPITFDDVARIARLRVVRVPRRLVAPITEALAPFVPSSLRAPGYVLEHLMHSFVVDAAKLTRATAWTPRMTGEDALRAMLAS